MRKGVLYFHVFLCIEGMHESVNFICDHPDIQAISFVGSDKVGRYIYERGSKHGKRVQANLGAKNHGVIMPDANKENTLTQVISRYTFRPIRRGENQKKYNEKTAAQLIDQLIDRLIEGFLWNLLVFFQLVGAAFGAAGQRCMALTTAVFVGESKKWIPELVERAKKLKVNAGHLPDADLGPVISQEAKQRILDLIQSGVTEGATISLDGREIIVKGTSKGYFEVVAKIDW